MKTDTAQKIITYIRTHTQATARELASFIDISPQALFRQLSKLQAKNQIYKIGTPPKVFYLIKESKQIEDDVQAYYVDAPARKIIDENYLIITPSGERRDGISGFIYWCNKTGQPVSKTSEEYVKTWRKFNEYKKNGLIDGTNKLKMTFEHTHVKRLYYIDFYSIERFGKTKLGQLLLYAKQSQNKKIIKELVANIQPFIERLMKKYHVDAVGFIPPTVKREVQFMKELERNLHLRVSTVPLVKVKSEIVVPQKTLNKLEDRIENAKKTIVVDTKNHYKNILLIDDAVGSGSTINETASQIKNHGVCTGAIIGFAITGSFKGFDVISEV